ncbi:flagellar motor protein MotB [Siphonobacter sp. SORGH_AS_0500]|uniref:OmpA family protein n=1 Tax=Siphonobacter sp. SORGH_AS_0500 TaxID=1864824 RepID=UPI000CB955D8|nr:OmpA family protein [Siphonobacter sp. SORGH_AS_0500]PKK36853.1 flagellar motor protein MotB [Siphonobacter sp. SORGH_AS_0500]
MRIVRCLSFLVLAGMMAGKAGAQTKPYQPNALYEGPNALNTWSISVRGGSPQFLGDLREYDFWPAPHPKEYAPASERGAIGFGLDVNKQLSHLFGASLKLDAGNLRGAKSRIYNSYFRAEYYQAALVGSTNLKSLLFGPRKLNRWKFDLHAGVGVIFFNSTAYEIGTGRVKRKSNITQEFVNESGITGLQVSSRRMTREVVFPVGLAIQYELSPRFDIGLDMVLNNVNTEKLDATVGGDNSSMYDFGGNRGDISDYKRGNSALDKYVTPYISVTYKFGKNAIKVGRDKTWDASKGTYNLRYTDPRLLYVPEKILSMSEIDSIAKANRPKDIDPRLLLDSDNDGVSDYFDKQPETPAGSIVSGAGVAIDFEQVVNSIIPGQACLEVFANINFETNQSTIKPEYEEMLSRIVELLNRTNCRLQLTGHADRRSSDRHNIALSERRVQAVKKYLVNAGVTNPSRILTEAYGSFKPIGDNTSKAGQEKNRRVELRFLP